MKKPAKAATVSAVRVAAKVVVMASAVMAVVVAVMAAVVNAVKVLKARFAPPAKAIAVAKAAVKPVRMAATNCVRAKPALHAVSVANVASAQSVLLVNVHPAKVAAMAAERAATTAEMKAAAMPCQS
jgi:hypothetical protein